MSTVLVAPSMALSAGMEVLTPIMFGADEKAALVASKCVGLLIGYEARWRNAPFLIDAVESVLTAPLFNPETKAKSRTFQLAGKLDIRAREMNTGARVIFDAKTTSDEIEDPSSPYWRILKVEAQPTHYMALQWLNAEKVDCAIWDVVKKPGIAPRNLEKKEVAALELNGRYCDQPFDENEVDQAISLRRETLPLYAARLAKDCAELRVNRYFQRRQVPRLDSEILERLQDSWDYGQEIIGARRSGRWPRNGRACMTYNSPCTYLGICSGEDTPDSDKWATKQWSHPELPILGNSHEGGKDVLTNSSIGVFALCRRKYFYQVEVGIERVDEEEKEARYFGTLWHLALEQMYLQIQKEQQGR